MSKDKGGDDEEVPKYKNSPAQELESWKQIQHKIDVSFHKTAQKEFETYAQRLQEKNTYFNNTKYPEINSKDIADDKMQTLKTKLYKIHLIINLIKLNKNVKRQRRR